MPGRSKFASRGLDEENLFAVLADPYNIAVPPCPYGAHWTGLGKRNCADSCNCLYGLGELKRGIWSNNPAAISSLGPNPQLFRRNPATTPSGLTNLGATCYLNSLVQCLYFNPTFRSVLYSWRAEAACPPNESPSTGAAASTGGAQGSTAAEAQDVATLQKMFAFMQLSSRRSYNPKEFINRFEIDAGYQQDAQEFNKVLLTHFESIFGKSRHLPNHVRTVIPDLFRGSMTYVTTCLTCGVSSPRKSDFYELEVSIRGHSTVEQCLNGLLRPELLSGDDKYLCGRCGTKQNATRRLVLDSMPEYLNVQLLRFVYDVTSGTKKKAAAGVTIPEVLAVGGAVYELCAVLYHKGGSAHHGHYVSDVYDPERATWWAFDDDVILPVSEAAVDGAREAKGGDKPVAPDEPDVEMVGDSATSPQTAAGTPLSADVIMIEDTPEGPRKRRRKDAARPPRGRARAAEGLEYDELKCALEESLRERGEATAAGAASFAEGLARTPSVQVIQSPPAKAPILQPFKPPRRVNSPAGDAPSLSEAPRPPALVPPLPEQFGRPAGVASLSTAASPNAYIPTIRLSACHARNSAPSADPRDPGMTPREWTCRRSHPALRSGGASRNAYMLVFRKVGKDRLAAWEEFPKIAAAMRPSPEAAEPAQVDIETLPLPDRAASGVDLSPPADLCSLVNSDNAAFVDECTTWQDRYQQARMQVLRRRALYAALFLDKKRPAFVNDVTDDATSAYPPHSGERPMTFDSLEAAQDFLARFRSGQHLRRPKPGSRRKPKNAGTPPAYYFVPADWFKNWVCGQDVVLEDELAAARKAKRKTALQPQQPAARAAAVAGEKPVDLTGAKQAEIEDISSVADDNEAAAKGDDAVVEISESILRVEGEPNPERTASELADASGKPGGSVGVYAAPVANAALLTPAGPRNALHPDAAPRFRRLAPRAYNAIVGDAFPDDADVTLCELVVQPAFQGQKALTEHVTGRPKTKAKGSGTQEPSPPGNGGTLDAFLKAPKVPAGEVDVEISSEEKISLADVLRHSSCQPIAVDYAVTSLNFRSFDLEQEWAANKIETCLRSSESSLLLDGLANCDVTDSDMKKEGNPASDCIVHTPSDDHNAYSYWVSRSAVAMLKKRLASELKSAGVTSSVPAPSAPPTPSQPAITSFMDGGDAPEPATQDADFASKDVNEPIACEHGRLEPDKRERRRIWADLWRKMTSLDEFSETKHVFPADGPYAAVPCDVCELNQQRARDAIVADKDARRSEQGGALKRLNHPARKGLGYPIQDTSHDTVRYGPLAPGVYPLFPKRWLDDWRCYITTADVPAPSVGAAPWVSLHCSCTAGSPRIQLGLRALQFLSEIAPPVFDGLDAPMDGTLAALANLMSVGPLPGKLVSANEAMPVFHGPRDVELLTVEEYNAFNDRYKFGGDLRIPAPKAGRKSVTVAIGSDTEDDVIEAQDGTQRMPVVLTVSLKELDVRADGVTVRGDPKHEYTWVTSPPICGQCLIEQIKEEERARSTFFDKEIYVEELAPGQPIPSSAASAATAAGSSRPKRGGGRKGLGSGPRAVRVSSSCTASWVRLRIMEMYDVMLGRLYYNGAEMPEGVTLSAIGVRVGDTVYARPDIGPMGGGELGIDIDYSAFIAADANGEACEKGFQGSRFTNGPPVPEWTCNRCTVVNDGGAKCCTVCTYPKP